MEFDSSKSLSTVRPPDLRRPFNSRALLVEQFMLVGAFDPGAWTGLVFCRTPGQGFAFRFAVDCDGRRYDGHDFLESVREVGPCAPDGSYAKMDFDVGVAIEWARANDQTYVGRVRAERRCSVVFRGYFPWDWIGIWTCPDEPVALGNRISLTGTDSTEREELLVSLFRGEQNPTKKPPPSVAVEDGDCLVRYAMDAGETLFFTAELSVIEDAARQTARQLFGSDDVAAVLLQAAERYAAKRVTTAGHWNGLAASVTNNLHWMVTLKPEDGLRYTPAGRKWIFPKPGGGRDHWTVFCWDAFFNALELAVESHELARDTLSTVLSTQYENGNIPNWRGRYFGTPDRSQPPVGSLVALKLYLRSGDRSILEEAFPILERWSAWWRTPKGNGLRRDGNGNGLFEWGCDLELLRHSPATWENEASYHQFAAWESGQDDLPNWDDAQWVPEAETLDLDSVDLNSLLALDFECLHVISSILGLPDKADEYRRFYDRLSDRTNELLWDEDLGLYLDRRWDGRMSTRIAASNFYPLVAGIAPPDRAERMLHTILDEKKFWGEFVLPTISRDDPAFADQQYWRGTIWPPTNYLVYQGLKRYRFDEAAAMLAQRSVDLFLGSWRRHQVCRENYDSRTGEGGGHLYQSWGPLFALMGIEELLDVTHWDGLRIGNHTPPRATSLNRIRACDRVWCVAVSPNGLDVQMDDRTLLTSSSPIVLRHMEVGDSELSAEISSLHPTTLSISLGTNQVLLTVNGVETSFPAAAVQVPAGEHTISIVAAPNTS